MRPMTHAPSTKHTRLFGALFSRVLPASLLALSVSCTSNVPSAQQTIPQLRDALSEPVSTPEKNKQNSELVVTISENKHIEGLSRLELESKLGKGSPCSEHPMCGERGFDDEDWYYEVGTEGSSYIRHRPALIVGFNRFGKVERTFVLEVL